MRVFFSVKCKVTQMITRGRQINSVYQEVLSIFISWVYYKNWTRPLDYMGGRIEHNNITLQLFEIYIYIHISLARLYICIHIFTKILIIFAYIYTHIFYLKIWCYAWKSLTICTFKKKIIQKPSFFNIFQKFLQKWTPHTLFTLFWYPTPHM